MYLTSLSAPTGPTQPDAAMTALHVFERALGVGGQTSTTTQNILFLPSTATSSTASQLATATSQQGDASDVQQPPPTGTLTKSVLEWVFAIAALMAIASITSWRYTQMRRRRQLAQDAVLYRERGLQFPLSSNRQRRHSVPHSSDRPPVPMPLNMSSVLFYPPSLTNGRYPVLAEPLPALPLLRERLEGRGRRGRRAAQGAEIDAQGRRTGARDPDDEDRVGESGNDDKDELPAYDNVGSPPQYVDTDGAVQVPDGIPSEVSRQVTRQPLVVGEETDNQRQNQVTTSNPFSQHTNTIAHSESESDATRHQPPSYPASSPSASPLPNLTASAPEPEPSAIQSFFSVNFHPC